MKRIISTLLFSMLLLSIVSSQTYYPIPESNTYWQYSYSSIPMSCPCWGHCFDEQIKVYGDTVVNEMIYHKLTRSTISYDENCTQSFYNHGYQGAFRNDVDSKKVWYIPDGEQSEVLLYDFNLEVGDTIPINYLIPYDFHFYIDEIDFVEVGNSSRKRYKIFGDINITEEPLIIIEGLGGQNLIAPFDSWWYFEEGYYFQCINMNNTLFYPEGDECEIMVKTNDYIKEQALELFPNPSTGKFWIKNLSASPKPISIDVFNSFGERLKKLKSRDLINPIDLSAYPKGIYLIMIKWENKESLQKIIIQ